MKIKQRLLLDILLMLKRDCASRNNEYEHVPANISVL